MSNENETTASGEDREKFYDDEIAPKLSEIAALCRENGMPMVAVVYFHGEYSGITQVPPTEPNAAWTLTRQTWEARGNIDALCISLARHVKPENDSSIVLRMLRDGPGSR